MVDYYYQNCLLVIGGLVLLFVENGSALRCWKCTSTTDATCRDYFNTTRITLNHRVMESYNYGNYLADGRSDPHVTVCDEMHTSTLGHFKNVCLKWIIRGAHNLNEVHRECRMVEKDFRIGACPTDIAINNRHMEYCGTCDEDECNSASTRSGLLLGLVPAMFLAIWK